MVNTELIGSFGELNTNRFQGAYNIKVGLIVEQKTIWLGEIQLVLKLPIRVSHCRYVLSYQNKLN